MFRSRNSDNWSKKIKKVGILFLCFLFLSLHLYLVMMHIQTGVGEIMERGKCDKDMFFFFFWNCDGQIVLKQMFKINILVF
jgi:hypothetical protein